MTANVVLSTLKSSQKRIISKQHVHPLYAKSLESQNVLKVKRDVFAVDGVTRQPPESNWLRPACCLTAGSRAAKLSWDNLGLAVNTHQMFKYRRHPHSNPIMSLSKRFQASHTGIQKINPDAELLSFCFVPPALHNHPKAS